MKNLTKRNKIVLAIAAVLVIAVVAVVIFFQASGEVLFGTVTVITISPSSSTIIVGQSETLSSNASFSNCSWISSNTSVVSITSSSAKSATVLAKGTGTVTITEKCGVSESGSATVTVNPPPTSTPVPKPTNTPTPIPPTPTPSYLYISPTNPRQRVSSPGTWNKVTLRTVNAVNPYECRWIFGDAQPDYSYVWYDGISDTSYARLANQFRYTFNVFVTCPNGSAYATVTFDTGPAN